MYTEYFSGEKKIKIILSKKEKMCMTCALHVVLLIKTTKIFVIEINKSNYFLLFTQSEMLYINPICNLTRFYAFLWLVNISGWLQHISLQQLLPVITVLSKTDNWRNDLINISNTNLSVFAFIFECYYDKHLWELCNFTQTVTS